MSEKEHEQYGFTAGKSTVDYMLALHVLVKRQREFRLGMTTVHVDLKKAFDSVYCEALWDFLRLHRITARSLDLLIGL